MALKVSFFVWASAFVVALLVIWAMWQCYEIFCLYRKKDPRRVEYVTALERGSIPSLTETPKPTAPQLQYETDSPTISKCNQIQRNNSIGKVSGVRQSLKKSKVGPSKRNTIVKSQYNGPNLPHAYTDSDDSDLDSTIIERSLEPHTKSICSLASNESQQISGDIQEFSGWKEFKRKHVITIEAHPNHRSWTKMEWNNFARERAICNDHTNSVVSVSVEMDILQDFNPLPETSKNIQEKGPVYQSWHRRRIFHLIPKKNALGNILFCVETDDTRYFAGVTQYFDQKASSQVWLPIHLASYYVRPTPLQKAQGNVQQNVQTIAQQNAQRNVPQDVERYDPHKSQRNAYRQLLVHQIAQQIVTGNAQQISRRDAKQIALQNAPSISQQNDTIQIAQRSDKRNRRQLIAGLVAQQIVLGNVQQMTQRNDQQNEQRKGRAQLQKEPKSFKKR